MYHHIKKLMFTVRVGTPDPRFGNMLLEQFGGANGELAAAMQYTIQGINCDDMPCKDLLMDIGTEELSHLEVIGTLARMHLKPMKKDADAAEHDPLIAIAGGGGVALCDSMGNAWTATYLKITGELDVDLRSNIAAEARAKIVYERLIDFCDDRGTKEALQFLMTREITHMRAFMQALDNLGKHPLSIGLIPHAAPVLTHAPNGFVIFESIDGDGDALVMVETVHANLTVNDVVHVALYQRQWSLLRKMAVFGDAARELLAVVAADIRQLPAEEHP